MIRLPHLLVILIMAACQHALADQLSPNPNPSTNAINVPKFAAPGSASNDANPFDNHGGIVIGSNGTVINNTGALLKNTSAATSLIDNYGSLKNEGTLSNNGVILIRDQAILDNENTLENTLILHIENGGTVVNNGLLDNKVTAEIQNAGTIVNNGSFTNEGRISGSGTIVGKVNDAGTLAPGESAGVHTIDGAWTKTGGSLEVELGGASDGGGDKSMTQFDWVDVTDDVSLAGQLHIEVLAGFALGDFQQFEIINVGGTLTGQFDGLDEGDLVGNFGRSLFITYGAGDGNDVALFTTNAIPEPTTGLLAGLCALCAGVGLRSRSLASKRPETDSLSNTADPWSTS